MTDPFALPQTRHPGGVPGIDREPFARFLIHEGRLLDDRQFEDWMALFTDDGLYWVPAEADQDNPWQSASLFFDDRELMKARITRLRHPSIHVQTPPSRTCHMVANVIVESADGKAGAYLVSSSCWVAEYRLDTQRILAARQYHRLVEDAGSFRIALKRVHLVNCDSAFEAIAVPI